MCRPNMPLHISHVTYRESQTAVWSNQAVDTGGKGNLKHTSNIAVTSRLTRGVLPDMKALFIMLISWMTGSEGSVGFPRT